MMVWDVIAKSISGSNGNSTGIPPTPYSLQNRLQQEILDAFASLGLSCKEQRGDGKEVSKKGRKHSITCFGVILEAEKG